MKKKTHDEYVKELEVKNSNIEVIGMYTNTHTKILHRCKKHNILWEITPTNALNGNGCCECKKERFRKARTKTHQEYIDELKQVNPNIIVVGNYIDSHTHILHKCLLHDVEWNVLPSNALKGYGCPECGKEKIGLKNGKTHKQYIQELTLVNPNIIVLEEYVNADTPILHKCLIDDYEWKARPANLLYGKRCPKCAGNYQRTTQDYIEELKHINSDIVVLSDYINAKTKIFHKCTKHNIEWLTTPSSILQGCGCIECGKEKYIHKKRKTHEQYIDELKKINPQIFPIEDYNGANIPILYKCLLDDCEWYATPANILFGTGCPQCNGSKGERQIRLWLDRKKISYISQQSFDDCRDVKPLPFDFYLPKYNLCIEFDGEQHYRIVDYFGGEESFKKIVEHDAIKTKYCKDNNIGLFRIPYNKNVEEELNNYFIHLI